MDAFMVDTMLIYVALDYHAPNKRLDSQLVTPGANPLLPKF